MLATVSADHRSTRRLPGRAVARLERAWWSGRWRAGTACRSAFAAFDKTGTLTSGRPQLDASIPAMAGRQRVLALVAATERGSTHALADHAGHRGRGITVHCHGFREIATNGVCRSVGTGPGRQAELHPAVRPGGTGGGVLSGRRWPMSRSMAVHGSLHLADQVRRKRCVDSLAGTGRGQVRILTGTLSRRRAVAKSWELTRSTGGCCQRTRWASNLAPTGDDGQRRIKTPRCSPRQCGGDGGGGRGRRHLEGQPLSLAEAIAIARHAELPRPRSSWYRDVGRSDVGGRVRLHSGGRWCTSPGGRGPRGNPVRAAGAPGASGRSRRFRAALASPLVLRLLPMLGRCARSAGFWPGRYSGIHNGTTAAGLPRTGNQPQLFLEKHRNLGLNSRSD